MHVSVHSRVLICVHADVKIQPLFECVTSWLCIDILLFLESGILSIYCFFFPLQKKRKKNPNLCTNSAKSHRLRAVITRQCDGDYLVDNRDMKKRKNYFSIQQSIKILTLSLSAIESLS